MLTINFKDDITEGADGTKWNQLYRQNAREGKYMPDMLVNLLNINHNDPVYEKMEKQGIAIRRAMAPDKFRILEWVKKHSSINAAGECDVCFSHTPISCFITLLRLIFSGLPEYWSLNGGNQLERLYWFAVCRR
mgnify:CR=1 FL=1